MDDHPSFVDATEEVVPEQTTNLLCPLYLRVLDKPVELACDSLDSLVCASCCCRWIELSGKVSRPCCWPVSCPQQGKDDLNCCTTNLDRELCPNSAWQLYDGHVGVPIILSTIRAHNVHRSNANPMQTERQRNATLCKKHTKQNANSTETFSWCLLYVIVASDDIMGQR